MERRWARPADALSRKASGQFLQSEPNPDQAGPRKWAWIVLDSFVRFGAFQEVTGNPNQKTQLPRLRRASGGQHASRPIAWAMGASGRSPWVTQSRMGRLGSYEHVHAVRLPGQGAAGDLGFDGIGHPVFSSDWRRENKYRTLFR